MLVIAISTAKGGTTKTTTTVNLACGLARRGYRVLCIDLDSQGHTTMLLNGGVRVDAGDGIDAVLQGVKSFSDVTFEGASGVHVAGSPRTGRGAPVLEQVNLWLGTQLRREKVLASALEQVDYDVVLLDCPPARNALVENALYAAHWIVCPIPLNTLAYDGIRELASFAEYVAGSPKPMSVLVSLFRAACTKMNTKVRGYIDADVENELYTVFSTAIPFTTALDKAIDAVQPIFDADPDGAAAQSYLELVDEIATFMPQQVAA